MSQQPTTSDSLALVRLDSHSKSDFKSQEVIEDQYTLFDVWGKLEIPDLDLDVLSPEDPNGNLRTEYKKALFYMEGLYGQRRFDKLEIALEIRRETKDPADYKPDPEDDPELVKQARLLAKTSVVELEAQIRGLLLAEKENSEDLHKKLNRLYQTSQMYRIGREKMVDKMIGELGRRFRRPPWRVK